MFKRFKRFNEFKRLGISKSWNCISLFIIFSFLFLISYCLCSFAKFARNKKCLNRFAGLKFNRLMVGRISIKYERKREREQSMSSYFLLHSHSVFRLINDARFWKMIQAPFTFRGKGWGWGLFISSSTISQDRSCCSHLKYKNQPHQYHQNLQLLYQLFAPF